MDMAADTNTAAPSNGTAFVSAFHLHLSEQFDEGWKCKKRGIAKKVALQFMVNGEVISLVFKSISQKNFSNRLNIRPYQRASYVTVHLPRHALSVVFFAVDAEPTLKQIHKQNASVSVQQLFSVPVKPNLVGVNPTDDHQIPLLMLNSGKDTTGAHTILAFFSHSVAASQSTDTQSPTHIEAHRVDIDNHVVNVALQKLNVNDCHSHTSHTNSHMQTFATANANAHANDNNLASITRKVSSQACVIASRTTSCGSGTLCSSNSSGGGSSRSQRMSMSTTTSTSSSSALASSFCSSSSLCSTSTAGPSSSCPMDSVQCVAAFPFGKARKRHRDENVIAHACHNVATPVHAAESNSDDSEANSDDHDSHDDECTVKSTRLDSEVRASLAGVLPLPAMSHSRRSSLASCSSSSCSSCCSPLCVCLSACESMSPRSFTPSCEVDSDAESLPELSDGEQELDSPRPWPRPLTDRSLTSSFTMSPVPRGESDSYHDSVSGCTSPPLLALLPDGSQSASECLARLDKNAPLALSRLASEEFGLPPCESASLSACTFILPSSCDTVSDSVLSLAMDEIAVASDSPGTAAAVCDSSANAQAEFETRADGNHFLKGVSLFGPGANGNDMEDGVDASTVPPSGARFAFSPFVRH